MLEQVKQNPITRALRIDKLTLAALEATLRLYRDKATVLDRIPTLRMLTMASTVIETKAERLLELLQALNDERLEVQTFEAISRAGGGSLPMLQLPSRCVGVKIAGVSANHIDTWLRAYRLPVIGRIEADFFMIDVRTVRENELADISTAFGDLLQEI